MATKSQQSMRVSLCKEILRRLLRFHGRLWFSIWHIRAHAISYGSTSIDLASLGDCVDFFTKLRTIGPCVDTDKLALLIIRYEILLCDNNLYRYAVTVNYSLTNPHWNRCHQHRYYTDYTNRRSLQHWHTDSDFCWLQIIYRILWHLSDVMYRCTKNFH
jgi:hypothetical protein